MLGEHPILKNVINGIVHSSSSAREQACTVFRNFTQYASVGHKLALIENGIFQAISENIKGSEICCLKLILEVCRYLLDVSKFVDFRVKEEFDDSGCLKGIEDLCFHLNKDISFAAEGIIKSYFNV